MTEDDDILEAMDDDFDDASMEDILDDSLDDPLDDPLDDTSDDLEDAIDELDDPSGDMDDALEDMSGSLDDVDNQEKESVVKKIIPKIKEALNRLMESRKAIIITAVSFVLFLIVFVGGAVFFFKGGPEQAPRPESTMVTEQEIKSTLAGGTDQVIFEDIVDLLPFERIELKTSSTMALINMNLSLELTDHRLRKQIYTMEDRIRKIIEGEVGQMTWLELRNPEGKILLKYNLLKRINSIFPTPTVRNIYFTYFIMQ